MKRQIFLIVVLFTYNFVLANYSRSRVVIKVDKRVELLRIVWNIAILPYHSYKHHPTTTNYSIAVKKHFKKFHSHRAIRKIRRLRLEDSSFPYIGTRLNEDMTVAGYNDHTLDQWYDQYGKKEIIEILQYVREFGMATDFDSFYEDHMDDYQDMINHVKTSLDSTEWVSHVEDLFKEKGPKRLEFLFDPLNNITSKQIRAHAQEDIIVIGLAFIGKHDPRGRPTTFDYKMDDDTKRIFYHEVAHYHSSKLTYNYKTQLEHVKSLFEKRTGHFHIDENDDWLTHVDETIVKAITAILFKINESEDIGDNHVLKHAGHHDYTNDIYMLLDSYRANPNTYPSFASFHPEIINWIANLEHGKDHHQHATAKRKRSNN